ncbi:MAG: putative quinol monooxygenase [Hyphomicrobiaceae bacterium]
MIYVIATMNLKPGTRDKVLAAAKPCIAATRQEKGCIFYDLNVSADNPDLLTFVERWESREDLAAHAKSDHIKAWRAASSDHVASRVVEIIEPAKVDKM